MKKFTPSKFDNKYKEEIKEEILKVLERSDSSKLYKMMKYFFGWLDEDFNETDIYGGKQYRSALLLSIAEAISGDYKKALPAAAAIELFHNFTLIHDDIEDNNSYRRGRKTVWKVWGVPHAINAGDAKLMLSFKSLNRLKKTGMTSDKVIEINDFMHEIMLKIAEGQQMDLDFMDLDVEEVTPDDYIKMITKKTPVLVGASAQLGAMCATDDKEKINNAYDFGHNFGVAYQVCDDLLGIFATEDITGKKELNDIYEKKKTLAVIYAFNKADRTTKSLLNKIYKKEVITEEMAKKVVEIIDKLEVYEHIREIIEYHKKKAIDSLRKIGSGKIISNWEEMVHFLTPDIKSLKKEIIVC